MKWTCCKCEHKYTADVDGDAEERMCYNCLDGGKEEFEEKEYCFNFRGKCLGVMAVSKESAYGFLYSEFDGVSKEELDDAYERGNQ